MALFLVEPLGVIQPARINQPLDQRIAPDITFIGVVVVSIPTKTRLADFDFDQSGLFHAVKKRLFICRIQQDDVAVFRDRNRCVRREAGAQWNYRHLRVIWPERMLQRDVLSIQNRSELFAEMKLIGRAQQLVNELSCK